MRDDRHIEITGRTVARIVMGGMISGMFIFIGTQHHSAVWGWLFVGLGILHSIFWIVATCGALGNLGLRDD